MSVPLRDRMEIIADLVKKLYSRFWLDLQTIPEITKDMVLIFGTTIMLYAASIFDTTYSSIFDYSRWILYSVLLTLVPIFMFVSITEKKNYVDIGKRTYKALRNLALYAAFVNVVMSVLILLSPPVVSLFSSHANLMLGACITIGALIISTIFLYHGNRPKGSTSINNPTLQAPLTVPGYRYSTSTHQDLKRLYLYQSSRLLMLKFVSDIPGNIPISIIDKEVGAAAIFSQQDRCMSAEALQWSIMFTLIGPATERFWNGSKSTLGLDDLQEFTRLSEQYLALSKPWFKINPTTMREELTKQSQIEILHNRTMDHCLRFIHKNRYVIKDLFYLLRNNDHLSISDIEDHLSQVDDIGIVPEEIALELSNNARRLYYSKSNLTRSVTKQSEARSTAPSNVIPYKFKATS